METYSKEVILAEAEKLADRMVQIEEVARFKLVENRLNQNEKIKKLINNMKALQKQAVNFQAYGKTEALKKVDAQIDDLQAEIDAIPIVEEFKELQMVMNDLLQRISQTITKQVEGNMENILNEN
ncbi:RicAFT regulatory complex protein RicA family protein [Paraliobacillus ryukyuensis]|uniref:RicAFT regulatory complex protein RicA family protein n=1 Tax=Paraliobacillus ryukyuensis TaxID=200904 RepID=UPI0009A5B3CC|nr:YlbF family regulator [Paraliobacillus ryukyuensis]